MITVTFQCATFNDLQKEIYEFMGRPQFAGVDPAMPGADKTVQMELPLEPKSDTKPFDIDVNAKAAAPAKKERKPRAKKEKLADDVFETKKPHGEGADEESAENESPAVIQQARDVGPAKVNKEAVHQALQSVNISVGLPKAREILAHFKVNRISEIKEDQYGAFIEKCNEATMMA